MLLRRAILILLGFFAGSAVSAGAFAFLLVIGVIPRMLRTARLTDRVLLAENIIMLGTLTGCILSLWERQSLSQTQGLYQIIGFFLICIYGFSAGIFVGCIAVSLAEILHTFPILFRRFRLTQGLEWLMCAMAIGKLCGALFSFYGGYWY